MSIYTERKELLTCPPSTADDCIATSLEPNVYVQEVDCGDSQERAIVGKIFEAGGIMPEFSVGASVCRAVVVIKAVQEGEGPNAAVANLALAAATYDIVDGDVRILRGAFSNNSTALSQLNIVEHLMAVREMELGLPFSAIAECDLARRLGDEDVSVFQEPQIAAPTKGLAPPIPEVSTAHIASIVTAGQFGVLGEEIKV
jgi:hypothetical protein